MSKILIIEDEEAIADLERDYLELSGFTVEVANDGDIGLQKALNEDYDLLILDDLGAERGTEYALEQVFAVIDARYRSRKPLIVTTNLTLNALKHPDDLAHARIYDRILEICAPILFGGENLRVEKANEMKTAARNILLPDNAA